MKINIKQPTQHTHQGAPSVKQCPLIELKRNVLANMLFENTFYESGQDSPNRIKELLKQVSFDDAAKVAIEAREKFKLRHVPLFIIRELLRTHKGRQMGDLIYKVIQRPDELSELIALYWKDQPNAPLPTQLKVGLGRAFKKFDEYQFSKWNQEGATIKLRDVLFLCHAKPANDEQAGLYKKIANNSLPNPDTWESAIAGGKDKKETFERLLSENRLPALAMLRKLRHMIEAGVSSSLIKTGLEKMKVERILPFRFIAAARHAPRFDLELETAMFRCLEAQEKLIGKTALLIDHSASMNYCISKNSDLTRFEAACAAAILIREVAEDCRIFAFSNGTVEVPNRRGFGLVHSILNSLNFSGTFLRQAVQYVYDQFPDCERLIVITDEQSADKPQHPKGRGYIINIGNDQNGIAYGPWLSITGWSEAIIDYIREYERFDNE